MTTLRVLDSPDSLVEAAARSICAELAVLSAKQEGVRLALAGGFVSQRLLPRFRDHGARVDWSRIEVFWVDERFVPAGDPRRNDAEAMRAFFDECRGATLHPMPADEGQSISEAAAAAESEWRRTTRGRPFDVALLGMGPDGHVASLFPGRPLPGSYGVIVVEDSPKPPPARLSFSLPVLRASARIHLIAAGPQKAEALARALGQARSPRRALDDSALPAARVLSASSIVWTDRGGAALLPEGPGRLASAFEGH